MQGLTHRQQMVLEYIRRSIHDRGYPPTLREIGAFMGIRSTNGVNDHLRALERKGYLTREDMKSRALRPLDGMHPHNAAANGDLLGAIGRANAALSGALPSAGLDAEAANDARPPGERTTLRDDDERLVEVPVVGRVAAGQPVLAEQNIVDTVRIDRMLVRGGRDVFALRVQGESMIDDGIHDGDYIFVRKQPSASRGDIVVALIGDDATVKYYFPEKEAVRLQPANAAMAPIYVRASDFKQSMILGVVVGVYRKL
ncbi:MAG: transcriptional repressor LexA [Myxococcales bacterium]|nr:transcriptional repressor LexA [Myxococcales bacterium]